MPRHRALAEARCVPTSMPPLESPRTSQVLAVSHEPRAHC